MKPRIIIERAATANGVVPMQNLIFQRASAVGGNGFNVSEIDFVRAHLRNFHNAYARLRAQTERFFSSRLASGSRFVAKLCEHSIRSRFVRVRADRI